MTYKALDEKVIVKKAFWAFHKKKGFFFLSDCYCKTFIDSYGTWAITPNSIVRISHESI